MSDHALLARLELLEGRVGELEDHRDITQLIAFIGPACDSGAADAFADRFLPDGVYNVGARAFVGSDQVRKVVAEGRHLEYMAAGCAHLMTPPHIEVDGDRAVAVNYTVLAIHSTETELWEPRRVSANRWMLRRVDGAWKVQDRSIDVLDGSASARELLGAVLGASNVF
ncbi:nuclear transport factor 2 family protein [Rhodococcus globerulus]|uniref:nuclear transport factor 2 family protein n=1 Tax=Rhodococcus globerulus TaxID=33008 RepID=UPI001F46F039|nr:nuclear transport factor 2 family protein [Rhodococcus globerulus]MCE4267524.1 nuclear transport factor 2 family protein [Rhodococcus globerulus]